MLHIEVIGLEPPCRMCNELVENVKMAVADTGIEARVEKKCVLSEEIRSRYGLLLSPALVIEGVVVAQGKVYTAQRIASLLRG